MSATAVIFQQPERLTLDRLDLAPLGTEDVVVEVAYSGISTGTERLLWNGAMPAFPGMGYPLVPGYEAVGTVVEAGTASGLAVGQNVFVPGSTGFVGARGLFGASASRLLVKGARAVPLPDALDERAVLLALAATAQHALSGLETTRGKLIVGHGVLGRLLARLARAQGDDAVTVWETDPARQSGADGYRVCHPDDDTRRDYLSIIDVSGDAGVLDALIARLIKGGEIVLAGFYHAPLAFAFPPAFMREARLRVAAEWRAADMAVVTGLVRAGALSFDHLITHRHAASDAASAYATAFHDPACLKMILDWRAP